MTRMLAAGIVVLLTVCGMSAVAPQTVAPLPVHQRVAVLVGVDRYQDRAIGRDLSGCRNDAVEMAEILRRKYRFAPATLIDHEATKQAVMDALRRAAEKAGPGDQVLFFFSGYGSVDGNGKPALCPYDALAAGADNDVWAGELWSWVNSVGRPRLCFPAAYGHRHGTSDSTQVPDTTAGPRTWRNGLRRERTHEHRDVHRSGGRDRCLSAR